MPRISTDGGRTWTEAEDSQFQVLMAGPLGMPNVGMIFEREGVTFDLVNDHGITIGSAQMEVAVLVNLLAQLGVQFTWH